MRTISAQGDKSRGEKKNGRTSVLGDRGRVEQLWTTFAQGDKSRGGKEQTTSVQGCNVTGRHASRLLLMQLTLRAE